jgi:hypothetical protein
MDYPSFCSHGSPDQGCLNIFVFRKFLQYSNAIPLIVNLNRLPPQRDHLRMHLQESRLDCKAIRQGNIIRIHARNEYPLCDLEAAVQRPRISQVRLFNDSDSVVLC